MDFKFTHEQEAFREEFLSWLKKNLPDGWDPSLYRNYDSADKWARAHRDFQGRLYEG